ncbi:hypothetical protein ATCVNTS1_728L [Acanthocystis turfacea Chlorella virus NTS-1]|nr:hypothetical protein ATCVNTS1_728L [Acanthocystis turfacea Chlorella virus NTS-1]
MTIANTISMCAVAVSFATGDFGVRSPYPTVVCVDAEKYRQSTQVGSVFENMPPGSIL